MSKIILIRIRREEIIQIYSPIHSKKSLILEQKLDKLSRSPTGTTTLLKPSKKIIDRREKSKKTNTNFKIKRTPSKLPQILDFIIETSIRIIVLILTQTQIEIIKNPIRVKKV